MDLVDTIHTCDQCGGRDLQVRAYAWFMLNAYKTELVDVDWDSSPIYYCEDCIEIVTVTAHAPDCEDCPC